jgi:hypothetical protein
MQVFIQLFHNFAAACAADATFFGIPAWYKYLVTSGRMATVTDPTTGIVSCDISGDFKWADGDLALVALGVLDMVLRIAAIVAVGYIVWAGIQYVTSEGSPDRTKEAQTTIINALVGLVIALIASAFVSFIGTKIG